MSTRSQSSDSACFCDLTAASGEMKYCVYTFILKALYTQLKMKTLKTLCAQLKDKITLDEHLEHLNHKHHSISTYCANKQTWEKHWSQQNNKPVEMNVNSI